MVEHGLKGIKKIKFTKSLKGKDIVESPDHQRCLWTRKKIIKSKRRKYKVGIESIQM